jgi:hypothetical protein
MTNLFIVITPIQYVNALELKSYLNLKEERNILILISSFYKTRNEIYSMLDRNTWDDVLTISKNTASLAGLGYLKYLIDFKKKLLKIIYQYHDIAKLIIGNYNDLLNHFLIQNVSYNKLYLLDDGLASLDISVNRLNEIRNKKSILDLDRYKKIRPKMARLILNLNNKIPEKIYFYTAYDLIKNEKDCFIENKYMILKSGISQMTTNQTAFFIGQPLTELKIVSEQHYFRALEEIIRQLIKYKVFYIPHRTEKTEKLKKISKLVEVKNFNLPIEIAVLNERVLPSFFITFYSSAIVNLSIIYGKKFQYRMYKINPEHILKGKTNILKFYKSLESIEIETLDLNDV